MKLATSSNEKFYKPEEIAKVVRQLDEDNLDHRIFAAEVVARIGVYDHEGYFLGYIADENEPSFRTHRTGLGKGRSA